ncbi:mortality factor 4-like protein 1 isoform X2 [Daktulosphaira vitifoliae]|uniref:mortality factor 4-like protein 1 isoform X2 n=1 Tax=Daktulosphaira vitifoliae TaxID=58002 RepID=UPI0021AA0223|nr:mortality factor 4-like protein 1 isoform X2 [Daktulosphaira vitifoliae]
MVFQLDAVFNINNKLYLTLMLRDVVFCKFLKHKNDFSIKKLKNDSCDINSRSDIDYLVDSNGMPWDDYDEELISIYNNTQIESHENITEYYEEKHLQAGSSSMFEKCFTSTNCGTKDYGSNIKSNVDKLCFISDELTTESYKNNNSSIAIMRKKKEHIIKYDTSSTEDDSDDEYKKNNLCNLSKSFKLIDTPRAAAVKATAAIAKHSLKKKRLKNTSEDENERRPKIIKECKGSDEEETELIDYGIELPENFVSIFMEDQHLVVDDRFIAYLPAKPSVYDILCDYAKKKTVDLDVLNIVLDAFNQAVAVWCLRRIEKLQYQEMIEKYPGRPMCHIYGLPHLVRFITCLPKLFCMMAKETPTFTGFVTEFIKGFLDYMVEECYQINLHKDYINVLPEYYRMTYCPIRIKR